MFILAAGTLVLSLAACSGNPAPETESTQAGAGKHGPSGPKGPSGPQGPSGSAGSSPSGVKPEVVAATSEAAAAALAAIRTCADGPVGTTPAETVQASGFPYTWEQVESTCGAIYALHDTWLPRLANQSRSAETLLMGLARVPEDIDYTKRVFDGSDAWEKANAVNHIHDALRDAEKAAQHALEKPDQGYDLEFGGTDGGRAMWVRSVENDQHGLGNLDPTFERLAFTQGLNPEMVRARMLSGFNRRARLEFASRRDGLAQASSEVAADEQTARKAYLATVEAMVGAYERTLTAFVEGKITTDAARDAAIDDARSHERAWRAAWTAERARLGMEPPPAKEVVVQPKREP